MRRVRTLLLVGLLTVALSAVAGCAGASQDPAKLRGPEWVVEQYRPPGESLIAPIENSTLTLTFSAKERVSGVGGVNRFQGTYAADDAGKLTLGPLASTKMAGPENLMKQETAYLGALEGVRRYRVNDRVLELFDDADNVLVRYRSTAE